VEGVTGNHDSYSDYRFSRYSRSREPESQESAKKKNADLRMERHYLAKLAK